MSEKDSEDLRWAPAPRRRHDRAVVRARRPTTSTTCTQIMDEEGVRLPVIAKIEKPQAVDNLDEIIDAFDGDHGRPRRPRRRAAARGGAAGAEARHRDGPAQRQAGHRRHPGARVDDRELPPDPRRGLRLRQRGARRRRRGDAVRRDQRRQAYPIEAVRTMARIIETTEEHGLRPDRPAGHQAPARPAAPSPRPPPRSATCSAPSTSSRSPSPATRPSGWLADPPASCRCWPSRPNRRTRSQLALDVGHRDLPRARWPGTPTRWRGRST